MDKMEGGEGGKKRLIVESLGWLTESSIMPKKGRTIEGVGASSILELKAHLYKSQEESRMSKELSGPDVEFHRAKKKIAANNAFSLKNSGVETRAHKDKLELKAVEDGSASYAALEKKAELYEKLMRGELSDEEEKEKYCVDFFRKGNEQVDSQQTQSQSHAYDTSTSAPPEDEHCETETSTLFNTTFMRPGRTGGTVDRNEHKRFVREVHEEANQAREKVSEVKLLRQEQVAARREKLKQAYLRKQLEKLTGASNVKQS